MTPHTLSSYPVDADSASHWPAHLEAERREPGEQPVQVALRAQSRWEEVTVTMCVTQ